MESPISPPHIDFTTVMPAPCYDVSLCQSVSAMFTCACFRTVAQNAEDDPLLDEYQQYVDQVDSDKENYADSMISVDQNLAVSESLANYALISVMKN